MENVTIKHNGEEYNIDRATLEKCKVIPKPTYDRMEVLRGEWRPEGKPVGTEYYFLEEDGNISGLRKRSSMNDKVHNRDLIYFPTRDLAEEYLLIAEGKWLPKKGDISYDLLKCDLSTVDYRDGLPWTSDSNGSKYIAFPSAKQRDEYIAKNKKAERPLSGSTINLTAPDGTVYKATLQ